MSNGWRARARRAPPVATAAGSALKLLIEGAEERWGAVMSVGRA